MWLLVQELCSIFAVLFFKTNFAQRFPVAVVVESRFGLGVSQRDNDQRFYRVGNVDCFFDALFTYGADPAGPEAFVAGGEYEMVDGDDPAATTRWLMTHKPRA